MFVEATSAALAYIRAAALQPSESRKRTCESLKTCADAQHGVNTDRRRRTVYTFVDDPDGGRQPRVSRKVQEWGQLAVNESAADLVADRDAGSPNGLGPENEDVQGAQAEDAQDPEAEEVDAHGAHDDEHVVGPWLAVGGADGGS